MLKTSLFAGLALTVFHSLGVSTDLALIASILFRSASSQIRKVSSSVFTILAPVFSHPISLETVLILSISLSEIKAITSGRSRIFPASPNLRKRTKATCTSFFR